METKIITPQDLLQFENYLIENEKSNATIQKYMHDVQCLTNYAAGNIITKTIILNYKSLLEKKYTVRSANSMIAAINTFLRFLGLDNMCIKQFKFQKEAYCSENKELTKGEYTQLIKLAEQTSNHRLSLVIQTLCSTGIRVSELQNITVESAKKGEALVFCKGKTRKIFIVKALQKKLLFYAARNGISSGCIFITKKGNPLNRSNIWREMKKLCKDTGISPQKVFPHNLRHLFARTFYALEKDIAKLADILGHSNINTTRIYIITSSEEHRIRMENMHLIQ